jgi:hypothetical protein
MVQVPAGAKQASIEVTVIRADGRVERLGEVAYWHKNPLRRIAWRVRRLLKGSR